MEASSVTIRRHPPFCKRIVPTEIARTRRDDHGGSARAPPQARRRPPQLRQADRGRPRPPSPRTAPTPRWRTSRAAPRSASARSTGTSRPGRRCSRRPTSKRSRRSAPLPTSSPTSSRGMHWSAGSGGSRSTRRRRRRCPPSCSRPSACSRELFADCHTAIFAAGGGLLERAQAAGVVRPDVTANEALRLVSGILMVRFAEPDETNRLLDLAMDGLRYRPEPTS